MNIDEALRQIAIDNCLYRLDIGIYPARPGGEERFQATAWGDGIGRHGVTSADGETASKALAALTVHVAELRALNVPEIEVELAA